MNFLNFDVQIIICSFLQPKNIQRIYQCHLIHNVCYHIGFVIQCTPVISNKLVQWFHEKQIKINLQNHELIYGHWFHKSII